MSKRIVSTILVSSVAACLLLAPAAFSAYKMPSNSSNEGISTAKIQSYGSKSYISEYKSYPNARRSALTLHIQNIVAGLD
ncbi:MAG: hypothetical protein V3U78_02445 [Thiotrichaceae bacterium]